MRSSLIPPNHRYIRLLIAGIRRSRGAVLFGQTPKRSSALPVQSNSAMTRSGTCAYKTAFMNLMFAGRRGISELPPTLREPDLLLHGLAAVLVRPMTPCLAAAYAA